MFIYGLIDPRTDCIRYVGKTVNLRARLATHCSPAPNSHHRCAQWIRGLLKLGLRPDIEVLEETTQQTWQRDEAFWIASLLSAGARLVNGTSGGEGITMYPETREKISAHHKGRKAPWVAIRNSSQTQRESVSKALKGRKAPWVVAHNQSPEMRALTTARNKSTEQRAAVSLAKTGSHHSEATKRKISAARAGFQIPEATKAKISKINKGKPKPAGFGTKIAEANRKRFRKTR